MNKRTLIFAAAVVLQILILLSVPAQKLYTRATGREVVLQVMLVDPYSILSGYYVTLGFAISRPENFPNPPTLETDEVVYAIVERQADGTWKPVALERTLSTNLSADRVAIRGRWNGRFITYGIEEFYIPEDKRQVIAEDLRQNQNEARVEIKVDAQGNAALTRLRIQDRVYE
jgi:uncharacterized membrane-anchored protein